MRKYIGLLILSAVLLLPGSASASEKLNIYFFRGDGCPHCAKEEEFLEDIKEKYDYVDIHEYEVWYDKTNQELLGKVKKELSVDNSYVPFTVIGTKYFTGYNDNIGYQIENAVKEKDTSVNLVSQVIDGKTDILKNLKKKEKKDSNINVPILGKVDAKKVSLPLLSVVIGLVDGFNPCAMWVLLFLISILIVMKDRKKMWILGLTFIISSALVYLLFMVAWLKVALSINQIIWVRSLIAIVALIGGVVNLRSFYKTIKEKDVGCTVTDKDQKKKTMEKIKKFTSEKSFILAILGIMALAFSINLVELACSAGLPLLYTQVLSMNNLNNVEYIGYILLYILFFMLDDLIVFFIAMFTMKLTGISNKYSKYSHLIGGIIMSLIGILLLVAPKILMFG
ncbi:MAG: hypothetical protein IJ134_00625 [Bacilli bacterium]|nr:hypothetical protein [Bacilli bacterium]